jgi:probable F420-dependent oxidoreductase
MSDIRFSIQIPDAGDRRAWIEKVRRAEGSGFYSLSVPDHLGALLPQLAPVAALACAAEVSSRLRLAITVFDNDFRHPVMLAKEVATLDLLSEGRVDLGMGAGWLEEDYTTSGIATFDEPATRVSRLFESIALLRELFTGETVTFAGEYYDVQGFRSHPVPVQKPIPLMVGATGRRMLRFAAREAQIVSVLLPPRPGGGRREAFHRQLAWIEEAGGRERDLAIGVRIPWGEVVTAGEERAAAERMGVRLGLSVDEVLDSPFVAVGDLARVKDRFVELHERYGVTYVTLSEGLAFQLAPVIEELGA